MHTAQEKRSVERDLLSVVDSNKLIEEEEAQTYTFRLDRLPKERTVWIVSLSYRMRNETIRRTIKVDGIIDCITPMRQSWTPARVKDGELKKTSLQGCLGLGIEMWSSQHPDGTMTFKEPLYCIGRQKTKEDAMGLCSAMNTIRTEKKEVHCNAGFERLGGEDGLCEWLLLL